MAYTVPTGSIIEVTLRASLFGETVLNVWHYRMLSTTGAVDGITTADAFCSMLDDAASGLTKKHSDFATEDYKYEQIVMQWINPSRYARIIYTPTTVHGDNPSPTVPSNMAVVTTKRTNLAGRIGLGSTHWTGWQLGTIVGNRIAQGVIDSVEACAQVALKSYTISAGLNLYPVLWPKKAPLIPVDITGFSTSNEPRTMRRRGVRLGI